MFVLTKDDEKFVLLPVKSVYTIGRLGTDLIVTQDLSISRNHVELHLPESYGDDTLQIKDLGSRFGTFIFRGTSQKPRQVLARTLTPVPVGIRIRFGGNMSIWQVTRLNLVTAVSALTRPEIKELTEMLEPMGGTVSPSWTQECSHLTMNEVSVTVKLLHALLENKPIVTFAYWRKMLHSAQTIHVKEGWPQPEDYQPTNMDVTWRPERTRLFSGKTFVFMNHKHFEMYGSVVQKAGASCKNLNSGVRKTFLTKSDVIVIQYVPSTQSQASESINSIQDILEQSGRRVIQDYEIGMALLHCSIKEFCNPEHKFINDSMPTTESMTSSMALNSSIIVPNTERNTAQSTGSAISELVVPESDACDMEQKSSKPDSEPITSLRSLRKRSHAIILDSDEEQEAASSKRAKPPLPEKPKITAKKTILVDSSDEEETVQPPPPVPAPNKHITKRGKPIYCADSSDEENTNSKKQKGAQTAVADKSAVVKKKPEAPVFTRTSPRLNSKSSEKQPTGSKRPVLLVASDDKDSSDEEITKSKKQKEAQGSMADNCAVVKKKQEASVLTRTSPRLNSKSSATNITNQQPKKQSTGSKRPVLLVASDDEEDDRELFSFRTAPQKPEATVAQPKSAVKGQPTGKISVLNFLEKSQPQEAASVPAQLNSQSQTQPRKRLRLELLNESDSDDCDNLFNFADSKKKKKKQDEQTHEDSTDSLFNINSERPSVAVDQDSLLTEPFEVDVETKKKSKYIVWQRKELPRKVDTSGWLSCSRLHDDIKSELETDPEVSLEKSIKTDPDEEKWLTAMKDSIEVRMCNLNIINRSQDEVDASLEASVSKYSGRKNFKKFVKTNNPHPQRRVVALKSMQLADGMVTCV
uniref:Nibrin n=1 Tax=Drosophila rhopaloa TaxID=1041015 RepID=A0A6P4EQL7_DRORH